jgi:hypothetical protein
MLQRFHFLFLGVDLLVQDFFRAAATCTDLSCLSNWLVTSCISEPSTLKD